MNKVQFLAADDGLHSDNASSYNGGLGGSVSRRSILSNSYAHSQLVVTPIEEHNGMNGHHGAHALSRVAVVSVAELGPVRWDYQSQVVREKPPKRKLAKHSVVQVSL